MPFHVWLFSAAGLVTAALLGVTLYFGGRDGEWHQALFFRGVDEMRRWKNGHWEYRPMTAQERSHKQENETW